jgi:hypothetical protein
MSQATAIPRLWLALHQALAGSAVLKGDKTYNNGEVPRDAPGGVPTPYVVIGGFTAGLDDYYHGEHGEPGTADLRVWGADMAEALAGYEDVKARLHDVVLDLSSAGWRWEGGTVALVLDTPEPTTPPLLGGDERTIGGHLFWGRYRSEARRIP